MTTARLETELIAFVRDRLARDGITATVDSETRLFEQGYLNSLRVLDLIAFLEATTGRRIRDRDVRLANFRTVRVIASTFGDGTADGSNGSIDRLFEHRTSRDRFASPIDLLAGRGDLVLFADGGCALAGSALRLLQHMDSIVAGWARELGAADREYPGLVTLDSLRQAGQLEAFPQLLTLAAHLDATGDVLERLAREPRLRIGREDLAQPTHAAPPAICYHCYAELAGRDLPDEPTVLTARGRCFRAERERLGPLERQRDFTMREIVVLGSRDQVEDLRSGAMRLVQEFVTDLGLDASIEAATDPFFAPANRARRLAQRVGALKYELRLTLDGENRSLAAASFNYHLDHFGTRFAIRRSNGEPAHSGCVAFGLERWVLGLFTQLGVDEGPWPALLHDRKHTGATA